MSIWKTFTNFFTRSAKIEMKPEKQNFGASWGASPNGVQAPFPPKETLNAYGEHAYLYAAVTRVSEDLAALPLVLTKGSGKDKQIITDHPVLDLLKQPSSNVDGYLFRQQVVMDLILNGTFWILKLGKSDIPTSLIRLHPEETKFVTDDKKGLVGVINTSYGQSVEYPIDRILLGRGPTYAKGPQSNYGTPVVQPLYQELLADVNAMMLASTSSKSGRPDVVISPKSEDDIWPKQTRDEIINSYQSMAKAGGVIALSGQANIDMLNLTPKDMEYEKSRIFARQSISSAVGVPGSVLGLPSANYATALEQRKTYWTNQMMKARKIDVVFTQLAKLYDPTLEIKHSFADVEALQNRDQALQRIKLHIENGMGVSDAYAYEGLEDAPFGQNDKSEPQPIDEESKNILLKLITKNNEERDLKWRTWIEQRQAPAEKEFLDASKLYLSKSKKLILKKFNQLKTKSIITIHGDPLQYFERDISLTTDMITPDEKREILQDTMGRVFEKQFNQTNQKELVDIYQKARRDLDIAPTTNPDVIGNFLETMNNNLMTTTIKEVNKEINRGINQGLSVSEIRSKINNSKVFNVGRAKRIARTEATKCINAAQLNAMNQAENEGIPIQKEWISERDDSVREAHEELDGQIVNINQNFVIPAGEFAGEQTTSPGQFGIEALDVNCRCVVVSNVQIQE